MGASRRGRWSRWRRYPLCATCACRWREGLRALLCMPLPRARAAAEGFVFHLLSHPPADSGGSLFSMVCTMNTTRFFGASCIRTGAHTHARGALLSGGGGRTCACACE